MTRLADEVAYWRRRLKQRATSFGLRDDDVYALAQRLEKRLYGKALKKRGRPPEPAKVRRFRRVADLISKGKTERQACLIVCNRNAAKADALRTAFRRWNKNHR